MKFLIYKFSPTIPLMTFLFFHCFEHWLKNDPFTLKFRMKLPERFENDEWMMDDLWTVTERTVSKRWTLCQRRMRAHAKRWTMDAKLRTVSERLMDDERTMNRRWANGEITQTWESKRLREVNTMQHSEHTISGIYRHTWNIPWTVHRYGTHQ